jgi:hypothetical protein
MNTWPNLVRSIPSIPTESLELAQGKPALELVLGPALYSLAVTPSGAVTTTKIAFTAGAYSGTATATEQGRVE